jgi:hypothetical protein
LIVPLPVALPPPVIVSQLLELEAVHEQLLPAVTATLPVAAVDDSVRDVGERE